MLLPNKKKFFNNYFTNMAKDIGSDDCIKDDDCLFACLTKHDQHDSIQNIKRSMESNYMYTDFNFHTVHAEVVVTSVEIKM